MIPPSFIQDLLARTDVVEVVGRHVTLKKAGINFKGLCPFHGEKSPSFIVSPTRQTYHCFGCGAHGDAIRFLVEHAGLGFIDAVEELAQAAGLQVPADDRSDADRSKAQAERDAHSQYVDVLQRATHHYRQQLKKHPPAIDYLKRRGLTGEIAARFGMGYAPPGWRGLASVFPSYDDPVLETVGLVIAQGDDEAERKRYDRFRDRIMFPIRSVKGEVIGFGGRVLDGGEPKYLNSPETPVFVKGRELYGLYEARAALRAKGYALVTEGYMDVVALAQCGFANAVATLGTACTADHVHKLLRFTDRVVFSFDGDAAGRRAAGRALEASLPHATDMRSFAFLFLPPEHDPDSYIRERGAEVFEKAVANAVPLSRQLVELASEDCNMDTAEGRARMLAQARPLWTALPEGALKTQLLDSLARQGGLQTNELARLWHRGTAPGREATNRAKDADAARRHDKGPGGAWPPVDARARQTRTAARGGAPTNPLDRVLWLLLHRPSLWDQLSADTHMLLADQAEPYGPVFAWIERECHGAADLAHDSEADAALDPLSMALTQRVRALLAPDVSLDAMPELESLLIQLELQALGAELDMLVESGNDLSPDATARRARLVARRSELKLTHAALMNTGTFDNRRT